MAIVPVPAPSAEARAGSAVGLSQATRTTLEGAGVPNMPVIGEITKERAKEGDKKSIEAMRAQGQQPPIAQETVNNAVKSHTQETGTDPAFKIENPLKPPGTVENAVNVTQEVANALNEYTKRGYDGLAAPPPRPDIQDALQDWAVKEMRNWPQYNDFFSSIPNPGMRAAAMQEAAISLLRNPSFRGNFRENLGKLMQQSLPDLVNQAKAKVAEVDGKIATNAANTTETTTQRDAQRDRIASFDDGSISGVKGAKIVALEAARTKTAGLETQKAIYETDVTLRQTMYADALKARETLPATATPVDIKNAETAITKARDSLRTAQKKVEEYNQAVADQKRLEAEVEAFTKNRKAENDNLTNLNLKLADLNGEKITLTGQKATVDAELVTATDKRKALEQEFQNKLLSSVSETVRTQLAQDLEDAAKYEEAVLERQRKEAKDKPSQKVYDAAHRRWRTIGTKGGRFLGIGPRRETTVYKDTQLNDDYRRLMTGGPKELMRRMLEDARTIGDPTATPPIPPDATITPELINEVLANDEFMKQQGQDLALNLLKQRRLSGRKMENADIQFMASTPWGQELAKRMITDSSEVDALLQQAKDAKMISGEFTRNDLLKLIDSNKGKLSILAIIGMLLSGGITGLASVGVLTAGKVLLSSSITQAAVAGGGAMLGGTIAGAYGER